MSYEMKLMAFLNETDRRLKYEKDLEKRIAYLILKAKAEEILEK